MEGQRRVRPAPDNGASVNSLAPSLTPLDRKVLAAIQKPRRIRAVAEMVNDRRPGWDTISDRDVREILNGLAQLGYAKQRGGGWWHRTDRGRL